MKILSLTCEQLAGDIQRCYGKGLFHAKAIYQEVFRNGSTNFASLPAFKDSLHLAQTFEKDICLPPCRIVDQRESSVMKFASSMGDGQVIESVLIPASGRHTLCVSSQIGCRMGCLFCATGKMEFVRNLTAEEIVWQVFAARFVLEKQVDNIVFMGMGEPLDNFDQVIQAVTVISDQRGLDIAPKHITISTAGHVDGLLRMAVAGLPKLRLAVSLNAADDPLRNRLMPINRKYPLERLKEILKGFPLPGDGVIFVEYVLLAGVNDSVETADKLADFLAALPVRVNVIAYNGAVSSSFAPPSDRQIRRFCNRLSDRGIFVRVRPSMGRSINAGCGQLRAALHADY